MTLKLSINTYISHRLIDVTTRHRSETEMETERLRTAQLQAERTLESREKAHRQRIKGLEEQVCTSTNYLMVFCLITSPINAYNKQPIISPPPKKKKKKIKK